MKHCWIGAIFKNWKKFLNKFSIKEKEGGRPPWKIPLNLPSLFYLTCPFLNIFEKGRWAIFAKMTLEKPYPFLLPCFSWKEYFEFFQICRADPPPQKSWFTFFIRIPDWNTKLSRGFKPVNIVIWRGGSEL